MAKPNAIQKDKKARALKRKRRNKFMKENGRK
jgi:hypothetical protein